MEVIVWLILSLAAYRITRFLVIDNLFDGARNKIYAFLANKTGRLQVVWHKLLDLLSCTWCLGFWISLILYSIYIGANPFDFTRIDWINVFAVAGIQGLAHAFEPNED